MTDQTNAAHDLGTSHGGRAYIADYFATQLRRHDFTRYINDRLAADFACALAQHLSTLRAPVADDMVHRLRGKYAMGPMIDGKPEFGWRDFSGPAPIGMRLPSPIMLEAAEAIERLNAAPVSGPALNRQHTRLKGLPESLKATVAALANAPVADPVEQILTDRNRKATLERAGIYLDVDATSAPVAREAHAVVYPPDGIESPFTIINLGSGAVQMGPCLHDGRIGGLWFGTDGQGMGHEQILNRHANPGETIAVVTFANVEGLDVMLGELLRCREQYFPAASAAPQASEAVRNAALEEAAAAMEDHQREGRGWVPGSFWDSVSREAGARIRALKTQADKNAAPKQKGDIHDGSPIGR